MRVVHVLAPAPHGGLETVVRSLARAQRAHGVDARVLILLGPAQEVHPFVAAVERDGTPLDVLATSTRAYPQQVRLIREHLRKARPDVFHSHGAHADVVGRLASIGTMVPQVSTLHGFTGGSRKNLLYEWLELRALRSAARVVAVAPTIGERAIAAGLAAGRVEVIGNALEPVAAPLDRDEARRRIGAPLDGPLIGWIGRLSIEKGADIFVEALERLTSLPWHACVIGDGLERKVLAERVAGGALATHLWFSGPIADAARLMPAFDIFVLSSRTEGSPMVILEAMAAHVPIIATRVGAIPLMLPGECGWIVPPADPAALATAIASALTDRDAALKRAAYAYHRVREEYGLAAWVNRYDRAYEAAGRA